MLTLRRSVFLVLLVCLLGLFAVQPMLPRSPGGAAAIHPVTGPARAWTGLEAMVGQFYLAVLIARLVGLHTSRRRRAS